MKIVFCAKGDRRLPSARTRAYLVSDYLREKGYESVCYHIRTRAWWSLSPSRIRDLVRNIRLLWSVKGDDVLFLQRIVHQVDFMLIVLLRKFLFGRGYVFDFDDAIFLEKGHGDLKARIMIRYADVIFCGNQFLKEYANRFNQNAHVITTSFDTEYVYVPYEGNHDRSEVVIGWTGTPSHYENMKLLIPALTRLVVERYPIRMQLLGGGESIAELFRNIPGLAVTVEAFPPDSSIWADPREIVRYLQNFDIGVMPLERTEWNKGKDAHKAKEYMCCGVATVASKWGENARLLKHGETALLVGDDGWYMALKKLIDEPDYRKKIATNGRTFVNDSCSFAVNVPKMLAIIKNNEI